MTAAGRPGAVRAAAAGKGPWYPDLPPRLPGEPDAAYSGRLTAAPGTSLCPYDHRRCGACALGYHDQCASPPGPACDCPHRQDQAPDIVASARPVLADAAARLAARYSLPEATGLRVMALTRQAALGGSRPDSDALRRELAAAYGAAPGDEFLADVTDTYRDAVTRSAR